MCCDIHILYCNLNSQGGVAYSALALPDPSLRQHNSAYTGKEIGLINLTYVHTVKERNAFQMHKMDKYDLALFVV